MTLTHAVTKQQFARYSCYIFGEILIAISSGFMKQESVVSVMAVVVNESLSVVNAKGLATGVFMFALFVVGVNVRRNNCNCEESQPADNCKIVVHCCGFQCLKQ